MWDRSKTQAWLVNNVGVDVIAQDVRMPIETRPESTSGYSSYPAEANRMVIIDLGLDNMTGSAHLKTRHDPCLSVWTKGSKCGPRLIANSRI
jgi:hypothetical protein